MILKKPDEEKTSFIVGIIVIVLAFSFGLFIIINGIRFFAGLFVGDEKKPPVPEETYNNEISTEYVRESPEWFGDYVKFVAMLDFKDFKDVNEIPDDDVITFAVWQITANHGEDSLEKNRSGNYVITEKDINAYIKLYFDLSRSVKHKSVESNGIKHHFLTKKYTVKSAGYDDCNIPKVVSIQHEKNGYVTLDVDYYNSIDLMVSGENIPPVKSVEIILAPNEKMFRFVGLRTIK